MAGRARPDRGRMVARAANTLATVKVRGALAGEATACAEEVVAAAAEVDAGAEVVEWEAVTSEVDAALGARVAAGPAEEPSLRRSFLFFLRASCA